MSAALQEERNLWREAISHGMWSEGRNRCIPLSYRGETCLCGTVTDVKLFLMCSTRSAVVVADVTHSSWHPVVCANWSIVLHTHHSLWAVGICLQAPVAHKSVSCVIVHSSVTTKYSVRITLLIKLSLT